MTGRRYDEIAGRYGEIWTHLAAEGAPLVIEPAHVLDTVGYEKEGAENVPAKEDGDDNDVREGVRRRGKAMALWRYGEML